MKRSSGVKITTWPDAERDPANAQTVSVVVAAQHAVRAALREHKLASNPVAGWRDGKVLLVPPEQIEA